MSEGWVKLHRQLQDNKIWNSEPFTRGQAWVDLILLANHEPGIIYIRDHKIELDRGDVGWSQNRLSSRWQWSRTKVRKFLNDLEKEQQVKQVKSKSYTVIRLINYKEYQRKEQQENKRKTTGKQEKDTNNNEENGKNEKNNYAPFVDFWNEVNDCNLRITDKKREQIRSRLRTFSEEELRQSIRNRSQDVWINGEGKKFKTDWNSFWRNDEKVERYLQERSNEQTPQYEYMVER